MIPEVIEIQTQPTNTSCVQTCLAMVTGKATEVVIKEIGVDLVPHTFVEDYLWQNGIHLEYIHGPMVTPGFVYLVDVPSMQEKGTLHKIVLDWRNENLLGLFDPMHGKGETYNAGQLMLGSLPFGNTMRLRNYRTGVLYETAN